MKNIQFVFVMIILIIGFDTQAQELEMDIQLRPRFEYRNGYKTLRDLNSDPASFVSQRSRLGLTYQEEKLQIRLSLQNVSTWGDKLQGAVVDKNPTGIFEAYANYQINKFVGLKAGRQVLSYDNERIFGEVNWTQAARTHDALLLKVKPGKSQLLDIGVALNADNEAIEKNPYQVKNYKSMEYAWYHNDLEAFSFSLLFLNTGYEFLDIDKNLKNNYEQTFGTFLNYKGTKFNTNAAVYGQTGKRGQKDLKAWYSSLNANYLISDNWVTGVGMEYLSGTSQRNTAENKSFTPLFGTNHAFNGFMDYFYVGNHQNSVGLKDIYGKIEYSRAKYSLQLVPHVFHAAETILDSESQVMDGYLATEIDFSASYKIQKNFTISLGYSQLFGTNSLQQLKGGDSSLTQDWAWLALTFNPKFNLLNR